MVVIINQIEVKIGNLDVKWRKAKTKNWFSYQSRLPIIEYLKI